MISKMGVKMNFGIITKNHAADSKIRSPQKIDFRGDLHATSLFGFLLVANFNVI